MISHAQFAAEYTAHFSRTVSFAARYTLNHEEAVNVAQYAWVRAWEKRAQWGGENRSQFRTWVFKIALNEFRDRQRKLRIRGGAHRSIDEISLREHPTITPDMVSRRWAEQLMERAKPRERAVFQVYADGTPVKEIAAAIGCPRATVRVRALRGRRRIKALRAAA